MPDTDIAALGIEMDTSQVVQGVENIGKLADIAGVAEAAVALLEAAATKQARAVQAAAESTGRVAAAYADTRAAVAEFVATNEAANSAIVNQVRQYSDLTAAIGLNRREVDQLVALRRANVALDSQEGAALAEIIKQYHDLKEARERAYQSDRQAGGQFQQRLNEHFGIARPAGDDRNNYASSARDSADVFRQQFRDQDDAARLRARADPLEAARQRQQATLDDADRLRSAGALPDAAHAQIVQSATEQRAADVGRHFEGMAKPFLDSIDAEERLGRGLDQLLARYDPLYAAQVKYNAAVAEIGRVRAANPGVGGEVFDRLEASAAKVMDADVGRHFGGLAKPFQEAEAEAERLRQALDPLYAAQVRYNEAVQAAQRLHSQGNLSSEGVDQAVRAAADQRSAAVDKYYTAQAQPYEDARQATEKYADQASRLRAEIDPLYAAQKKYDDELLRAAEIYGRVGDIDLYRAARAAAGQRRDEAVEKVQGAPERERRRADSDADRLRDQLLDKAIPGRAAQRQFETTRDQADKLLAGGKLSTDEYKKVLDGAKEAQDNFNKGLDETGKRAGLSGQQMFWLVSNVKDFFNQVYAGGSVSTAFLQQGPMLAQILAMGQGGVAESLKSIPAHIMSMVTPFRLVAGGVTGVGAALAYLAYQGDATRASLERSTFGVGRRTQMMPGEIDAASRVAIDPEAGISRSGAREAAEELAKSGNLTQATFEKSMRVVRDLAFTTGQDTTAAAKELAEALSGEVGAADALNAKLGFLSATTRDTYNEFAYAGDKVNAQKTILDALGTSLENATAHTNVFMRAWNLVKVGISSAIDNASRSIDTAITGGTLDEQLKTAERELAAARDAAARAAQQPPQSLFNRIVTSLGTGGDEFATGADMAPPAVEDAQKRYDDLRKKVEELRASFKRAADDAKGLKLDSIVSALSPLDEQIRKVTGSAQLMREALVSGNLPADKYRETENALRALDAQLKEIKLDADAGGAAFREMVISSKTALDLVGSTDLGRQLRTITDTRERTDREISRSAENVNLTERKKEVDTLREELRTGNVNGSEQDSIKADISKLEADISRIRAGQDLQRRSADETAANQTQAAREGAVLSSRQQGGAFARAPSQVQGLIIDAIAQGNTRVPQNILGALIEQESSFRETARPRRKDGSLASTAYGYTQLLDGTAEEVGVNKFDPAQNVLGGARYLQKMLQQFGDIFTALAAYHDGPGATQRALDATGQVKPEGAAYARIIMRRSGDAGGQSQQAIDERVDSERRRIDLDKANYGAQEKYLGRDKQALDAATYSNQKFAEEMARSGSITDATRESIKKAGDEFARINQQSAALNLSRGMDFDRSQLGRSEAEAAAYSKVRGAGVDTDSPVGQALIDQTESINRMQELKASAKDAFGTIYQGIKAGQSASEIFSNVLGRLTDKLVNMASDQVISQMFKMFMNPGGDSGGGGFGGIFGSLFKLGGSSGASAPAADTDVGAGLSGSDFAFARGGVMTPEGPLGLRRYATGGVAAGPQVALFGEGSQNEAYVPLPDNRAIPVTLKNTSGEGSGSAPGVGAINVTVNANGSSGDPEKDRQHADDVARRTRDTVKAAVDEHIATQSRPGGSLYGSGLQRAARTN